MSPEKLKRISVIDIVVVWTLLFFYIFTTILKTIFLSF